MIRWHAFASVDALQHEAARRILAQADEAIAARGEFSIVLAGGETPRPVYRLLRDAAADWARWRVWFGDERCLAPEDTGRNSRMAREAWLDRVAIAPGHVHEIPAEHGPEAAAAACVAALHEVGDFDCVLLGLGEDGHTASLFPGHPLGDASDAPDALAVLGAPKPPPERVTLSARRLSRARQVLFLVAGESKREAVRRWRAGEPIPAARVRPEGGVDVLVEERLLD